MAEPLIRISSTSMVAPSKPTKRHSLYLSSSDQIMKYARPSRTILFYKTEMEFSKAVEHFKQNLSTVLISFYPLAGRLFEGDDGKYALNCNDEGIEFVEAHSDISFAEVEQTGYKICNFFRDLTRLDDRPYSDHTEDPLASIQITSFVGGLTVGIVISHVAADGYSFWQFVKAMGQVCRGESISVTPLHMRTALRPETFLLNRMNVQASNNEDEKTVDKPVRVYNGAMETAGDPKKSLMLRPPEELHQGVIKFSREMLETLKRIGSEDAKGSVSSFEALSAYCWKRLTKAQGLDDATRVDFRVPLDIRSRFIPPLTTAYFGNAVVAVTVPTTAGELTTESLGATAMRIRECINQGDDKYIKQALIARETMDLRKLIQGTVVLFNVRNASRFPVYEAADFGWGKPEAVRPPWTFREGELTWYPGRASDGSIDVEFAWSDSTMARFFSPKLRAQDPLGDHELLAA